MPDVIVRVDLTNAIANIDGKEIVFDSNSWSDTSVMPMAGMLVEPVMFGGKMVKIAPIDAPLCHASEWDEEDALLSSIENVVLMISEFFPKDERDDWAEGFRLRLYFDDEKWCILPASEHGFENDCVAISWDVAVNLSVEQDGQPKSAIQLARDIVNVMTAEARERKSYEKAVAALPYMTSLAGMLASWFVPVKRAVSVLDRDNHVEAEVQLSHSEGRNSVSVKLV